MPRLGNFNEVSEPEEQKESDPVQDTASPSDVDKNKLDQPDVSEPQDGMHGSDVPDAREKLTDSPQNKEVSESERPDDLDETVNNYFDDLRGRSEYPETIQDRPFEADDLRKLSPEETAEKRDEFDDKKSDLKNQWAEENDRPWPTYNDDVYSSNGKLIRHAGGDHDAHHIQPLSLGGENDVSNITPLHASEHYDRQGVHAPDSPYSKIDSMLGEER